MNPIHAVRPWFSSRMARWLDHRLPAVNHILLGRKNIFILPTGAGLLFLAATLLIFVTAINYVLSLAFALAFLMTSLFILGIFHTFRNLQHLCLRGLGAEPVFAGEEAAFGVSIEAQDSRRHEVLELAFPSAAWTRSDVEAGEAQRLLVYLPTQRRGELRAPRLRIQTRFPLGLWRAWSIVDLAMVCVVYPAPRACVLPGYTGLHSAGEAQSAQAGVEDFQGMRAWQSGDSLKQIAWKNFARGQGLMLKQFVETTEDRWVLDWDMFPGLTQGERLSCLCYWALEFSRQSLDYGLRLPGVEITPGRGEAHRRQVLRALALWQEDPS